MNRTEDNFVQKVWDKLLKEIPSIKTLPPHVRQTVELGFIYGATTMGTVLAEVPKEVFMDVKDTIISDGEKMMDRLKEEVLMTKSKVDAGKGLGGAMPDIMTGFPLDKEFKL